MKYVTFSFDDGFLTSTLKTARIYNSFDLRAEFNVTASFAASGFRSYTGQTVREGVYASFDILNELQERGHVIQPHGFNHTNKAAVNLSVAKSLVTQCIEVFNQHLKGFEPTESIFCFPYNSSNDAIEKHVGSVFRAFRTGYDRVINPLPTIYTKLIYGDSWSEVEQKIDRSITELLALEKGWLVYNTHGLDGEGWESVSSEYLTRTLERLLKRTDVRVLPMSAVLDECVDE